MLFATIQRTIKQYTERRSSAWPALRRAWLQEHGKCDACGTTKQLEVHHVVPVSHDRTRELDKSNLQTLCEYRECHHRIGHSFDFKSANPHCRLDAETQRRRISERVGKPLTIQPPGAVHP